MERITGIEPATSTLARSRSTKWAKSAEKHKQRIFPIPGFIWRRHPESDRGIKVLQTSALPLGYGAVNGNSEQSLSTVPLIKKWSGLRGSNPPPRPWQGRALPNELNPHKVNRVYLIVQTFRWCLRSESNQRHGDFQSPALPTELQRHIRNA